MKKTLILSALLISGLADAAGSAQIRNTPIQVIYELKLEKTKNGVTEIVSENKTSSLVGMDTPTANYKTISYIKECTTDLETKKQVLTPGTVNVGLYTNLVFTEERVKNSDMTEYKIKFTGNYNELLNIPKVSVDKCEIETPNTREWNFTNINKVNLNEPIVLGNFGYVEHNHLLHKDEEVKYKITLKVVPN